MSKNEISTIVNMTNDIQERIKKLEEEEFILSMKDTWDEADFTKDYEIYQKILELKGQIANENK